MLNSRIVKKIKSVFINALNEGTSASKLALTCSIGMYIAFSPFPGAHTIMVLTAKWLFKLNLPILFIVSSLNNPWTMIPVFTLDYYFGYWLIHTVLGINPPWILSLSNIFGSGSICICSFLVGGNILGIISFFVIYPLAYFLFKKINLRRSLHNIEKYL